MHFQLHESELLNQGWLGIDVLVTQSPLAVSYYLHPFATPGNEHPGNGLTHGRKLYLKQMVAHFGHVLGVQWNLAEENFATAGTNHHVDFTLGQLAGMAAWIERWDGYHDHPIAVHSHAFDVMDLFPAIAAPGQPEWLDVTSAYIYGQEPIDYRVAPSGTGAFAAEPHLYDKQSEDLRHALSTLGPGGTPTSQGSRIVISVDEQGDWRYAAAGVTADPMALFPTPTVMSSPEGRRRLVLYDVLLSGATLEWYCGFGMSLDGWSDDFEWQSSGSYPPGPAAPNYWMNPTWMSFGGGDVSIEEFRSRQQLWESSAAAGKILELVPYWLGEPDDTLVAGDPSGGSGTPGPNAPSNGGAYGPQNSYGRAQVLACSTCQPAYVLVYYPTAYNGQTPLSLGTLALDDNGDAGYAGQFYSPLTGLPVGAVSYFEPLGGFYSVNPPPANQWPSPAPAPDVVFLVNKL